MNLENRMLEVESAIRTTLEVLAHLVMYGPEWDDEMRLTELKKAYLLVGGREAWWKGVTD